MNNLFDVIIVWAWPAWSNLAYLLWNEWFNVLLIDKEKFPRNKACWWWLSLDVISNLSFDIPNNILEGEIKNIIFDFRWKKIEKKYNEVISYTIKREKFDNFLFDKALSTKKVHFLKCNVKNVLKVDDIFEIDVDWIKYFWNVLVWADWVNSIIKKTFFVKRKFLNFSLNAIAVAYDKCSINIEKYKKDTFYFFFWSIYWWYKRIFPNLRDYNIWIWCFSGENNNLKSDLVTFLEDCNWKSNYNLLWQILPYWCNNWKNWFDDVILIWDSAWIVDPFTWEWIWNAILSSKISFEVIKKNIFLYKKNIWTEYDKKMRFLYLDLLLMLLFTKFFHYFYNFCEKIVLANDYVIDWYVDISKWKISRRVFIFRFFIYSPIFIFNFLKNIFKKS